MAVFTFGSDSPIGGITLRRASTGTARAYLEAGPDWSAEQVNALLEPMREKRNSTNRERGWQFIPTNLNGKPVLEVRDFGTPVALWESLQKHGLLVGKATGAQKEPEDKPDFRQRILKQVLRISGALYLIGDISFFIYGALGSRENTKGEKPKSKIEEQLAAIFYMMGSASLVFFARDTSSQQLRDIGQHLQGEMLKYGITAGGDTALGQIADTSIHRPIDKAGNFIRKYHSDIMNLSFAASGLAQIAGANADRAELQQGLKENTLLTEAAKKAALQGGKAGEKALLNISRHEHGRSKLVDKLLNSRIDIAVGALTASAGAVTMLTPEKTEEEREKLKAEKNPIKRAVNWFREKPMRISGYGLLGSTALHLVSSLRNLSFSNQVIRTHNELASANPQILDADGVDRLLGDRSDEARKTLATHDKLARKGRAGLLTADELDTYHRKRTSFGFRMVFVVTNIIAELLMTFADKGHGESVAANSDVAKSACAMVAEVIARQPEERHPHLVQAMAEVLASSKGLGGKAKDYVACLADEVRAHQNNPWASRPSLVSRETARIAEKEVAVQEAVAQIVTPERGADAAAAQGPSPLTHLARAAASRAAERPGTPEDLRAAAPAPRSARYAEERVREKENATELARV